MVMTPLENKLVFLSVRATYDHLQLVTSIRDLMVYIEGLRVHVYGKVNQVGNYLVIEHKSV